MPHPAVGSTCDKVMMFPCRAGRRNAGSYTAEQPVNQEYTDDTNQNAQPAQRIRQPYFGPCHPARIEQIDKRTKPEHQPGKPYDRHHSFAVNATRDFLSTFLICLAAEGGGNAYRREKDDGGEDTEDVFVHGL